VLQYQISEKIETMQKLVETTFEDKAICTTEMNIKSLLKFLNFFLINQFDDE